MRITVDRGLRGIRQRDEAQGLSLAVSSLAVTAARASGCLVCGSASRGAFRGAATPCTQRTRPCCCCRAAYVTRRLRFGFGLSWWTLRRCNKVCLHARTHQHRDTPKLFVLAGTPLPNMTTARIIALFNVQGALAAIESRCHHQKGTERTESYLPACCNGDTSEAQAFIRLQPDGKREA